MQQSEIKQRLNPFRTPWRCADVVTVLTVKTGNVLSSVVAVYDEGNYTKEVHEAVLAEEESERKSKQIDI